MNSRKNILIKVLLSIFLAFVFSQVGVGGFKLKREIDEWYIIRFITLFVDFILFTFSLWFFHGKLVRRTANATIILALPTLLSVLIASIAELLLRRFFLGTLLDAKFFTFYLPILVIIAFGLSLILFLKSKNQRKAEQGKTDSDKTDFVQFFIGSKGSKNVQIDEKDVSCFYIENGILYIFTQDGVKYRSNSTLDKIESQSDPVWFFRLNRQCIVRKTAVDHFESLPNRKILVKIKPNAMDQVVSKSKAPLFRTWVKNGTLDT